MCMYHMSHIGLSNVYVPPVCNGTSEPHVPLLWVLNRAGASHMWAVLK